MGNLTPSAETRRKPDWLRKRIEYSPQRHMVKEILRGLGLNTVCEEARCPNQSECFYHRRATFLILGNKCTRNCRFCSIDKAKPGEILGLDEDEPKRVAEAVKNLRLKYVVITSVTRDDLDDGGASQFAKTIEEIKKLDDRINIEVLTPDFKGDRKALDTVINANPDVFNHNVETISRLYPNVRPQADFNRSLDVLKYVKEHSENIFVKSGFMVGLGETRDEIIELLHLLKQSGCDAVTIGQYLQPTKWNIPVKEYISPETFDYYRREAKRIGFKFVASGPFVRSSYMAHEGFESMVHKT